MVLWEDRVVGRRAEEDPDGSCVAKKKSVRVTPAIGLLLKRDLADARQSIGTRKLSMRRLGSAAPKIPPQPRRTTQSLHLPKRSSSFKLTRRFPSSLPSRLDITPGHLQFRHARHYQLDWRQKVYSVANMSNAQPQKANKFVTELNPEGIKP